METIKQAEKDQAKKDEDSKEESKEKSSDQLKIVPEEPEIDGKKAKVHPEVEDKEDKLIDTSKSKTD